MELVYVNNEKAMQGGKKVFNHKGVYVYESLIPYTFTSAHKVFFVSGVDGKEYGQFASQDRAVEKALQVIERVTVNGIEKELW